jgi:uncharacterized protein (DUF305 family)
MSKKNPSDICRGYLTDDEYLQHMIPHHQVAIDMSNLLIEKTNAPILLDLCRQIIRSQSYEIWEMTYMKTYDDWKGAKGDKALKDENIKSLREMYKRLLYNK